MSRELTLDAFNEELQRWYAENKPHERLGQRLMNVFNVRRPNATIFYETNHAKAARMFYDEYVEP